MVKLGAAFLPLDQDYPTERIEHMLNDSLPDLVITDDAQHPHLAEYPGALMLLDERRAAIASEPDGNLQLDSAPEDRAYLLYTSGSSGRPKGVLISAGSLWNLCCWYQRFADIAAASSVIHAIPLSFDASIKNILTPLLAGGTLVLPPGTRFDPAVFNETIDRHQVTVINCVPSLFYSMLEQSRRDDYRALRSLLVVALGGEASDVSTLWPWLQSRHCQASIANIYGPTECTDISVACRVTAAQLLGQSLLPIGRPIDNTRVYVVTPQMTLAPPGVGGELLIGGAGVGIGSFGQAAADTDKFVADPFGGAGRLYRSGDLVRWDRHGRLHYQGRLDKQIKINGIRIEAGEIEAALSEIQGIRQALVMLAGMRLTAYVVTSGLTPPTASQLREQLRNRQPMR